MSDDVSNTKINRTEDALEFESGAVLNLLTGSQIQINGVDKTANLAGGGGGGGLPVDVISLVADDTFSGGTAGILDSFSFTPVAGKIYRIEGLFSIEFINASSSMYIGVSNDMSLSNANTLILLGGQAERAGLTGSLSLVPYISQEYGLETGNIGGDAEIGKRFLFKNELLIKTIDTTPIIFWCTATTAGGVTIKQDSKVIFTQLD